jgi:hypothetical protein
MKQDWLTAPNNVGLFPSNQLRNCCWKETGHYRGENLNFLFFFRSPPNCGKSRVFEHVKANGPVTTVSYKMVFGPRRDVKLLMRNGTNVNLKCLSSDFLVFVSFNYVL